MTVFGSLQVVDDFNRANEATLTGGGRWTVGGGNLAAAGLKLTSNAITRQAPAGAFARDGSYYNAFRLPAGATASVSLTITQMCVGSAAVSLQLFDVASRQGYGVEFNSALWAANTTNILRFNASQTDISSVATWTYATNDVVSLAISGSDIITGVTRAGAYTEITRVTDTTYRTAWTMACEIAGNSESTGFIVDDLCANYIAPGPSLFQPVPFVRGSDISTFGGI